MISKLMLAASLALASAQAGAAKAASSQMEAVAQRLVSSRLLSEVTGPDAAKTIEGARTLWTDLVLQKPEKDEAFKTLAADIKGTDMEATLKEAGFKLLDPKKKSLALGLRPTLVLVIYRMPKGAEGLDEGFYLVTANVVQDCTPMGGKAFSLSTWVHAEKPIPFSGDDTKDIAAIRASARACVKAFIETAQEGWE